MAMSRPIAILQADASAGPGYFATWAADAGLATELIRLDQGDPVPAGPQAYAGLCVLGGAMSVNDTLPWITPVLELIRTADAQRVPVIGHCLGGQLLARAFGAAVVRHPVKELGWRDLHVTDAEVARDWLGADVPATFEMFHWHGDSFGLPQGAQNFLASDLCAHQAYVLERGAYAHLGMQFHCEMTPALVQAWATDPEAVQEIEEEQQRTGGPGVQPPAEMLRAMEARAARINEIARRLYERWRRGLRL
jgi:GMP synthase-like glutamine amidotransferase